MGTELVLESSENLHILTRLSARENFIEFCRRESFKTSLQLLQSHDKFVCKSVSYLHSAKRVC